MPLNPTQIQDLAEVTDKYRKNLVGDNFLLYDSYEDDDFNLNCRRIVVFAIYQNLIVLFKSEIWFLDGTFQVVPSIFSNSLS